MIPLGEECHLRQHFFQELLSYRHDHAPREDFICAFLQAYYVIFCAHQATFKEVCYILHGHE
ncbi:MAG: hypothetical protein ACK50V_02485, partial [Alphaproteobacteria bacterium]